MAFSKILGHNKTMAHLKSLLATGRVPPALLFCGPEGVGKFMAAREFAKALACLHTAHEPSAASAGQDSLFADGPQAPPPPPEPGTGDPLEACGLCASCLQVDSGAHPDVRIIDTVFQAALLDEEESRNLKVDTIRELCRYASRTPILSSRKVYIVRDAEAMVAQAQNAILKTLEEPPPGTTLILTVSRKTALLSTILSRCHTLPFGALPRAVVGKLLEEQGVSSGDAGALGELSQGSLKKASDLLKLYSGLRETAGSGAVEAFRLAAALPKDTHRARQEVITLLDLLLGGARNSWANQKETALKKPLGGLVARLLALRRMTAQYVSYALILELALLESAKLGILPGAVIRTGAMK